MIREQLLSGIGIAIFIGLILLQFVNYALENLKWRLILPELNQLTFLKTQKAVYAGNAIAILTPDRLGTFIGRFSYLKEYSKSRITLSTFVGNYAQLVTTLLFSLIGMVLAWNMNFTFQFPENLGINILIICMIVICCIAIFIFYNQQTAIDLLKRSKRKYAKEMTERFKFMDHLTTSKHHFILSTAILRYTTFVSQFYLALILFGADVSLIWTIAFCGILYLFSTIIPSPFMGNLGTREAVGVYLVSPLGLEEPVILASLFIWLINVVLPSLLGGLILLKK